MTEELLQFLKAIGAMILVGTLMAIGAVKYRDWEDRREEKRKP